MGKETVTAFSRASRPERFGACLNFVVAMCLLACIAFQFSVCLYNHHKFAKMDERIHHLEQIMEKIFVEGSPKLAANQTTLEQNKVVREKRAVQQTATNLRSLAKRVNVIENR